MAARLFLFVQFEFPWELGPPDGRYVVRAPGESEPQHVLVLNTLGASPRAARGGSARTRRLRSARAVEPLPPPSSVAIARATIVDPVPLSAERQARAWLDGLDAERELSKAAGALNRALYLHRVASADPFVREVSPPQALVARAGWGEGEQVADGQWLHARELAAAGRGRRRGRWPGGRAHSAALRSSERLAQLLGGRAEPLLCEELVLRARLDLDEGRLRHAALALQVAYAAALPELRAEAQQALAVRIGELTQLQNGVQTQARVAGEHTDQLPDEEILRHATERLEAALRARTAYGLEPGERS
ncbi:MAG TPA: hypothetical protein VGX51_04580 [Solirubrobacteraceae bacterium]|nr:hypothetical protein [Solirubrobacteraceae bacterium]